MIVDGCGSMRKISKIFLLCFLMNVLLMGCTPALGDGSRVIFLTDFTNCNLYNHGDKFAFTLYCLYRGKEPDVKFVSFDNVTATSTLVEMRDATIDLVKDRSYKGYKCLTLGFFFDVGILEPEMGFEIGSVTLSVNGENKVVNFDNEIRYMEVDGDGKYSSCDISAVNVPMTTISGGEERVYPVRFVYLASNDVEITNFEFNDFFDITKSEISIDDSYVGSIEETFPVILRKNSKISINMDITYKDGYENFADYFFDAFLYLTDSSGEDKILLDTYMVQSIGNYDEYCSMIDYLLESRR